MAPTARPLHAGTMDGDVGDKSKAGIFQLVALGGGGLDQPKGTRNYDGMRVQAARL